MQMLEIVPKVANLDTLNSPFLLSQVTWLFLVLIILFHIATIMMSQQDWSRHVQSINTQQNIHWYSEGIRIKTINGFDMGIFEIYNCLYAIN